MSKDEDQILGVNLEFYDETGRLQAINVPPIPADMFWRVYFILNDKRLTPTQAMDFAKFVVWVASDGQCLTPEQYDRLMMAIAGMQKDKLFPDESFETPEDAMLWYSYQQLQHRKATYKTLADIASRVLDQQISEDTWRKRVTRWAEKQQMNTARSSLNW